MIAPSYAIRQHRPFTAFWTRLGMRFGPLALLGLMVIVGGRGIGGNALRYAFTATAFFAAIFYYFTAPRLYLGYVLCMWFFNPFFRRLVDVHGYTGQNVMSLVPLLVSAVAAVSVLRYLPSLMRRSRAPYLLLFGSLLYGLALGAFTIGVRASTYTFGSWLLPLLFGLSIALHWRRYPELESEVAMILPWLVLITGVYGVYQWVHPPSWDTAWMIGSKMSSIGQPLPYKVRVFSMLNAPGPFGIAIGAGLIVLLGRRSKLSLLAGVAGAFAFLLSLNRTAWLAWILAALIYAFSLRGMARLRLLAVGSAIILVIAGALVLLPLAPQGKATDTITTRLNTFTDLSSDQSYNARSENLVIFFDAVLRSPLGHGLGSSGVGVALDAQSQEEGIHDFDNGILETYYTLGWFAGSCWLIGVIMLFMRNVWPPGNAENPLSPAFRAAAWFCLVSAPSTNPFVGVGGMLLWLFVGLTSASRDLREDERSRAPLTGPIVMSSPPPSPIPR